MRSFEITMAALLLGCGAPATPPPVSPEGDAPSEAQCTRDDQCVLTNFVCSVCGRCPGDPPWAALPAELAAAEEECLNHPPAGKSASPWPAAPACQPCDGGFQEFVTLYRAVCLDGHCMAEPYATEPVPPPGGLLDPGAPAVNP